jgi:Ca2+-binding EF-hand superfamily protein
MAFALALSGIATVGAQAQAQNRRPAPIRFQEMDRNQNGVIERSEWRGSAQSFQVHDWNRDGVLSGAELRLGGEGPGRTTTNDPFESAYQDYSYNDWSPRGFAALDHNRDGRITPDEWHFDRQAFLRGDHNADGAISRVEFLRADAQDDDREDGLGNLDLDNDGRVSREEWLGARDLFNMQDTNRDGFLSRVELMGDEPPTDLFASVDMNRDGSISRAEWHWSRVSFDQRDTNHDARLTRAEFTGATLPATQTSAYRAGDQRGLDEGRAAGHEDRLRNQGWDLEGQRELETADSGYDPRFGAKPEYQAGYREGFRRAYRDGWNQP